MTDIPYTEKPETEDLYRKMERLGQELKVPIPGTFLQMEVFDGQGNRIHAHRQRSHSWNRNAYNILFGQIAGVNMRNSTFEAGKLSVKQTSGVIVYGSYIGALAGSSIADHNKVNLEAIGSGFTSDSSDYGIQVGSGSTPESFEGTALETLIASGTGAGQLSYIDSEPVLISYDPSSKILTHSKIRFFNNNSGGSISVNEVGLTGRAVAGGAAFTRIIMFSRDVLAATVTVPDTGQLKVTYIIELAYPE